MSDLVDRVWELTFKTALEVSFRNNMGASEKVVRHAIQNALNLADQSVEIASKHRNVQSLKRIERQDKPAPKKDPLKSL